MRDLGRWISACRTLRFVSRLYWRPVKRNGRIITAVTGCGYGSDSISGDAIVLAQGGELLLHLSHHFVCGLLLLPSAQRHSLHTQRQRGYLLSCTRFFKTVKYFHLILNKNTADTAYADWHFTLTSDGSGKSGSIPAWIFALWTMSLMTSIHLSTPTSWCTSTQKKKL